MQSFSASILLMICSDEIHIPTTIHLSITFSSINLLITQTDRFVVKKLP